MWSILNTIHLSFVAAPKYVEILRSVRNKRRDWRPHDRSRHDASSLLKNNISAGTIHLEANKYLDFLCILSVSYDLCVFIQKAAFSKFPDLRLFSLANVASVDTRESLQKHFGNLR